MGFKLEEIKCPKCKKKYLYNPDQGVGIYCPNCAKQGLPPVSDLEKVLRQDEKTEGNIFRGI